MSDRSLAQYADILRNDFAAFTHRAFIELHGTREFQFNWHIELLAAKFEAVRHGRCPRLIVNLPPRHFKSFMGSIAFPAFVLGHDPSKEILCISYAEKPAEDSAWDCRKLMQSRFYQALFRTRLAEDRQAVDSFKTTAGGERRARSLSGGITGGGADLIIIDDPLKANEALSETRRTEANDSFYSTIYNRLNEPDKTGIVLIMQRLHVDDYVTRVTKRAQWDQVSLPAIAEADEVHEIRTPYGVETITRKEGEPLHGARFSLEKLLEARAEMEDYLFSAQYQQRPLLPEGSIVKREWLQYYDASERPESFPTIIQSWDTAYKTGDTNSYSVCTTWGIAKGHFYLLDRYREREKFDVLCADAKNLYRYYEPDYVLVEQQALGVPLIEELEKEGATVVEVRPNASNKIRLYQRINKFTNHQVHLPREASWLDEYVSELTQFPEGTKHDDQVDSTIQALGFDVSLLPYDDSPESLERGYGPRPKKEKLYRIKALTAGMIMRHERANRYHAKDETIELDLEWAKELCADSRRFVWVDSPPKADSNW